MISARQGAWAVLCAALVSSLTSLGNGFALDDILVIKDRALLHSLAAPLKLLTTAYWQLPPEDTLWRPLGLLSFAMQWAVGDGAPIVFHAVSIAWYLAVCLACYAFALQLLPAAAATITGLVFAVHPVHVESVGNIVGQLELGVALAVLVAGTLYLRARRAGPLDTRSIAAIVVLYAFGLGFKEHAVMLPAFLIMLELTVLRDARPRDATAWMRLRVLYWLLFGLAVLWLAVRSGIVGGLAGDRPHVALRGLDRGQRSWVMLGLFPEFVRLLLWPARLYADYSPSFVRPRVTPSAAHIPGVALLLLWSALSWWAFRRRVVLALGLLWLPLSVALVANILVPSGILLAERTLFLATVGVAITAGALADALWPAFLKSSRGVRAGVVGALALLLGAAAAHSAERQWVWESNESLIASLVVDAPENFRGHFWLGDDLLRAGKLVEGEVEMRRAMALWPEHDGPPIALALRYQERGLCGPALPLYARAMQLEPEKPTPRFGFASCLLTVGRLRDARTEALAGLATGRAVRAFRFVIYTADSALAATDSSVGANWWVRRKKMAASGGQ